MPIQYTEKQLQSRTNQIRKLLSALTSGNNTVASSRAATDVNSVILAAHSGQRPVASKHTDWRFKTLFSEYTGCYYEVWIRKNNESFLLKNAYLQILYRDKEIVSLHCDPLEPTNSKVYKYKCGPHLHVKHPTNEIISNAHIALNLDTLDEVLTSLQTFEKSFRDAINMIKEEFIAYD